MRSARRPRLEGSRAVPSFETDRHSAPRTRVNAPMAMLLSDRRERNDGGRGQRNMGRRRAASRRSARSHENVEAHRVRQARGDQREGNRFLVHGTLSTDSDRESGNKGGGESERSPEESFLWDSEVVYLVESGRDSYGFSSVSLRLSCAGRQSEIVAKPRDFFYESRRAAERAQRKRCTSIPPTSPS